MNYPAKIFFQSFVKPFYRENAGVFLFFFVIMFAIIGKVDGSGVFEYHYSLITGMLNNISFLWLVFLGWLLYVRKCVAFVNVATRDPHFNFLYIFRCLSRKQQFRLFCVVSIWLLVPVLLYAALMVAAGFHLHQYFAATMVVFYMLLLCLSSAAWHVWLLNNLHSNSPLSWQKLLATPLPLSSYTFILVSFLAYRQKLLTVAIKVFTCALLYLVARNNSPADGDISFPFLFFNFGVLATGVLVYRLRVFEQTFLSFYRSLPVSPAGRFLRYALVYLIFLIPEIATAAFLAPAHLTYLQAASLVLSAYSLLLLMHSITYLRHFRMKDFIKILFIIFCVQFLFLLTAGLVVLSVLFFTLAVVIFSKSYYSFEPGS